MLYVVLMKSNSGKVPVIWFVDALAYILLIYVCKPLATCDSYVLANWFIKLLLLPGANPT